MDGTIRPEVEALLARLPALEDCRGDITAATDMLIACFRRGGQVLLCGNGGSAADCGHIAGELLKGFLRRRPLTEAQRQAFAAQGEESAALADRLQRGLPAIDLTAHGALLTAALNDIGGEDVFAQQVVAFGRPGDVLLGLSTSGGAANVCNALRAARALGLGTIALTGQRGGAAASLADVAIRVPADETYRVQEYHLPVYHALCAAVEAVFFDR